jgi:hypothetical protein
LLFANPCVAARCNVRHGLSIERHLDLKRFRLNMSLAELRAMAGFPVLAVGFDPRPASQIGVDWNVPVRVGGATVLPGDAVVADDEAVVFFPASIADEVIARATRVVEQENYERALARTKQHRFRDVYPMSPELRKKFEEEKKKDKP